MGERKELDNGDLQLEDGSIILCARRQPCEVYSRVVGYIRPVGQWNKGKQSEWKDRVSFELKGGKLTERLDTGAIRNNSKEESNECSKED
jgi:hypothetical protein